MPGSFARPAPETPALVRAVDNLRHHRITLLVALLSTVALVTVAIMASPQTIFVVAAVVVAATIGTYLVRTYRRPPPVYRKHRQPFK